MGHRADAAPVAAQHPARDARLDIVIVNWNSGDHLRRCLASLGHAAGPGVHVYVVDNASTDGSASFPADPRITLVVNGDNRGFAAACNQGAALGSGEAILFLNPDTVVPSPESLLLPLEHLMAHAGTTGVVGVQLRNADGSIARSCSRFPAPRLVVAWSVGADRLLPGIVPGQFELGFDHASTRAVDVVMGAFFLTTRALFRALGGFDERFFMYYEEVDFAYRARRAGFGATFLADAHVTHAGHGSSDKVRARRLFYALRSRMLFGFVHFPAPAALIAAASTLVAEPVVRVVRAIVRGDVRGVGETIQAAAMLWAAVPRLRGARS